MTITITSIRLRSMWQFFKLSWLGLNISRQAATQPGYLMMKNAGFGYMHYTISAWDNEEAMKAFAYKKGAHQDALKESQNLSTEIKTYSYQGTELPDWITAKKLVDEKGKVLIFR